MAGKISDKLLDVAQKVFDQYKQDFASADEFFSLDDFAYWIGVIYAKDVDDTALSMYKNSLAEFGIGSIAFSQDWWKSKEFDVKNKEITLDISYAGFSYDTQNSGIQLIVPVGCNNCGEFIRTTIEDAWVLKHHTTSSNIWWYIDDNKVILKYNGKANVSKAKVFYIPTAEDEKFALPKSREFLIASTAWQFLTQAKAGVPVLDETNDFNRNKVMQGEMNSAQLQPLKQP